MARRFDVQKGGTHTNQESGGRSLTQPTQEGSLAMADKQREPKAEKKREPKIFVTVTFEPDLQAQVDLLVCPQLAVRT